MKYAMVVFLFVALSAGSVLSQTTPKKYDATRSDNVFSSSGFLFTNPKYLCNDGTIEEVLFSVTVDGKEKIGPYCFHDIANLLSKFLKPAVEYKEPKPESKDEKIKRLIRELSETVGKN